MDEEINSAPTASKGFRPTPTQKRDLVPITLGAICRLCLWQAVLMAGNVVAVSA
jgi:hypothetical protein